MLRFFTSDLYRNLIKVLCLTLSLSIGFLLVAKIYFEQTYDSFFRNGERLYRFTSSIIENGEYKEYDFTSGGTAGELRCHIPQIELTTRVNSITGQSVIKLEDGREFEVEDIAFADTCLFDVLPTSILEGNPHEALAVENRAMIPRSLADKIGSDVIGLSVTKFGFGDLKPVIAGVYEDYPLNSTIRNAIYISMPTTGRLMWDGSDNLIGNERYRSYAILAKDSKSDELDPAIQAHLKKIIPEDVLALSGYKVWLRPLSGAYSSRQGVRTISWMLGLLATVLLLCASLNYLLITIGQLVHRSKEMAIRKCYGTSTTLIFIRVIGESLFFMFLSLVLAILISFSLSDLSKQLLGYTAQQLLTTGKVWLVEGCVCGTILIITGIIPAFIYTRTPVVHAFRPVNHGNKGWKLALLAIQFFATGLILCLLVLIYRQYNMVTHLKIGFEYANIGRFYRNDLSEKQTSTLIKELKRLSFIEDVATSGHDLVDPAGDSNMWIEGRFENQVNVADMGFINPEVINLMGINILQGRNFRKDTDSTINEVIVEERFIELLNKYFCETDKDIIGKTFYITGHGSDSNPFPKMTIVGVIENIHRGSFECDKADLRAGVLFPTSHKQDCVYVRFTEMTPENLKEVQKIIDQLARDNGSYIIPYTTVIDKKVESIRKFGTAVMVVGIVIILIALIGLIGYVADEVNRRAKEIAIRKVNGTPATKIVRLFCIDILKVALPSLILGGATAMIVGQRWLAQFTDRVSLSPLSMIACLIVLLLLITGVVICNSLRVARSNPVDHLRSE